MWTTLLLAILLVLAVAFASASPWDPAARDFAGHRGVTLYVSKQGDNTDGRSWKTAYRTIEAALLAIPDAKGGHRVIVRPDTYHEANLYPSFRGAPGAYNELVGDFDGRLGSGATGWVLIDAGDPAKGLKCVDWWGAFRCDPDFSGSIWDRWIYRRLYAAGSEGGIGWDMTCDKGCEFSAVVEDCVGIGRFAGGCVIAHVGRAAEPVVFRRCFLMNLDWWGDAGGVYVRGENRTMPAAPDAVFEDCTIVGPDNALQVGWAGVDERFTRVRFTRCRLIVLNFSQPRGTPSTGIVNVGLADAKQCHLDFEDCDLMGFKVFGVRAGTVAYTTKGRCRAYVQLEQEVPSGFERLGTWPADLFAAVRPPALDGRTAPRGAGPL